MKKAYAAPELTQITIACENVLETSPNFTLNEDDGTNWGDFITF